MSRQAFTIDLITFLAWSGHMILMFPSSGISRLMVVLTYLQQKKESGVLIRPFVESLCVAGRLTASLYQLITKVYGGYGRMKECNVVSFWMLWLEALKSVFG